jgi:transcriptional regulator with PAS, ATPase and Fis domain
VDIRLVAATNADLHSLVEKGSFRKDLFYRINVLHIAIPPLRDRREDISELAMNFLGRLNRSHGTHKRFGKSALGDLVAGHYAGNVRELQNVVERAYFMSGKKAVIQEIGEEFPVGRGQKDDVASWFEDLRSGRQDFWEAVHEQYKRRDISRQKVTALMHVGLRETRGSYKNLARLLRVRDSDYRRFMDFLRRNKCQPDFRPYRRLPSP